MDRTVTVAGALALVLAVAAGAPATAQVIEKRVDFAVDAWQEIEGSSGAVTVHRVRIATGKGGFRAPFTGEPNEAYLEPIEVQIEFTNESGDKIKSRISVRWLDAAGEVIDGFETKEGLNKRTARGIVKRSLSTSKYGLGKAAALEITVTLAP